MRISARRIAKLVILPAAAAAAIAASLLVARSQLFEPGQAPLGARPPFSAATGDFVPYEGALGEFQVSPKSRITHKIICPPGGIDLLTPAVQALLSPNSQTPVTAPGCGFEIVRPDGAEIRAVPFEGPVTVSFEAPRERLQLLTIGGHSAIAMKEADKFSPAALWVIVRNARNSGYDVILAVDIHPQGGGLDRALTVANAITAEW